MRLRPIALAVTLGLALVGGLGVAGLAGAPAAGAHEGGGTIAVEAAHPAGSATHFIIRLTWDNDGHPATDATVTATPVDPAGTAGTPVEMTPYDDDGRYQAPVEMTEPGTWTVRFTSIEPTGTAETTAEVEATTTTTSGSPEVSTGTGSGDSESAETTEGGFAPEDDGTGDSAEAAPASSSSGDDSDGMPVWLIVVAALVAIVGVVTAVGVIRRTRPEASSTDDWSTDDGKDGEGEGGEGGTDTEETSPAGTERS